MSLQKGKWSWLSRGLFFFLLTVNCYDFLWKIVERFTSAVSSFELLKISCHSRAILYCTSLWAQTVWSSYLGSGIFQIPQKHWLYKGYCPNKISVVVLKTLKYLQFLQSCLTEKCYTKSVKVVSCFPHFQECWWAFIFIENVISKLSPLWTRR